MLNINNGRRAISTTSDVNNIEYYTEHTIITRIYLTSVSMSSIQRNRHARKHAPQTWYT